MKKILLILSIISFLTISYANDLDKNIEEYPFLEMKESNNSLIYIYSEKPLTIGINKINLKIKNKNNKFLTDVKTKLKIFMPEMPGMSYMEYISKGELENNVFKFEVNFGMSGTWQYQLKIKDIQDKITIIKGNFNI